MCMNKDVIILGAGGHAKVIADIVIKFGDNLLGFLDDNVEVGTKIIGDYAVMGTLEDSTSLSQRGNNIYFAYGIGDNKVRRNIHDKFRLNYYTAIHPTAVIGLNVQIGEGTVIMPNAVINSSAKIGIGCIINTCAVVEHDNVIGDFVHISPNATLCGRVYVGDYTHIGAATVVRNNINICDNVIVGAGAVIIKNITEQGVYVGVPAKKRFESVI